MLENVIQLGSYRIRVISLNSIVLGSGAAGFNAADRIWHFGQKDLALVTEGINSGISRNTGSDKQTYYKLSLAGGDADSVSALAQTFFKGECVDGDHALCEAALSAPCFFRLVELGVPFPQNRYGEYVGYKTDHDPNRRATSVGPYTSRIMTECLEKAVREKGIPIFDQLQAIQLFKQAGQFSGMLCIDKAANCLEDCLVLFNCKNLVLATGGPAGMYANSVYPSGHYGANGLAFEAGVKGKNLTEWQFGLASVSPRWNVSGTYMQVLPQFISTDAEGGDRREFLLDYFDNKADCLSRIFLKGYQWPFDVRRVRGGSSLIDLLVYVETTLKSRRVFLDFRDNPGGVLPDFQALDDEARDYLEKAEACFGKPIDRLLHMNAPAVSFFLDKGIDLASQPLEIALCAQHNNGGLDIDCWWQTNIDGLFAVGEAAASHGVYRPGGSALNAGQVGSTRAARFIASRRKEAPEDPAHFLPGIKPRLYQILELMEKMKTQEGDHPSHLWQMAASRMDGAGGAVRDKGHIEGVLETIRKELSTFPANVHIDDSPESLAWAFRLKETLLSQLTYLSAMLDYLERGRKSRGSALYVDEAGDLPDATFPDSFRFALDDGSFGDQIQIALYENHTCSLDWRRVRELPQEDDFFENVWRSYRENQNVY